MLTDEKIAAALKAATDSHNSAQNLLRRTSGNTSSDAATGLATQALAHAVTGLLGLAIQMAHDDLV